ncbi:hypothetical protein [Thermovibrio sp.]
MNLFDLFRKRSEEELFHEAIVKNDYMEIAKLGEKLLQKDEDNLSVLMPYIDALVKLGKKEKAVKTLIDFAEKKLREEYFELAIPVLKKALRIDPLNLKAIRLLVSAYKKKELYYDAFHILLESFRKFKEAKLNTDLIKETLEEFIQEQFHPLFYEKYGDLLEQEGKKEKALINYVLAANLYVNLKNYKSALRALLKAEKINKNKNIDKQLVEVIANLAQQEPQTTTQLLLTLLCTYKKEADFIKYTVETFKEAGNLKFLKSVGKELLKVPKTKYALLALINYELGESEEAEEYLEKLKLTDRKLYEQIVLGIRTKFEGEIPKIELQPEESEELPEPEQVLEVLEKMLDFEDVATEFIDKTKAEERPENIKREISVLKEMGKDGHRFISTAEALMGLEKYDEAIREAKEAINTKEALKAISIIAEAYKLTGRFKEALNFLFEELEKEKLSEEDRARIKVLIGEIHEAMGDKEKAVMWYKEANKVLNDPEIEEKIESLVNERV